MTGEQAELDVSIILPVYNEIEHLDEELERIRSGYAPELEASVR